MNINLYITQIPSNVNGATLPIFLPQFYLYIFVPNASLISSAVVLL